MISFGKAWRSSKNESSHHSTTTSHIVLPCSASTSSSLAGDCAMQQELAPPPQAHYSFMQLQDDRLGEFLGGKAHRTRAPGSYTPPPFSSARGLETFPASPDDEEPKTLAHALFICGFFFPVFWMVAVAITFFTPLRPAPEWETDKSEEERQRLLARIRVSELKWAKRCLYAIISLLVLIMVLVITTVLIKR